MLLASYSLLEADAATSAFLYGCLPYGPACCGAVKQSMAMLAHNPGLGRIAQQHFPGRNLDA